MEWDAGAILIAGIGAIFGYGRLNEKVKRHDDQLSKVMEIGEAVARIEAHVGDIKERVDKLPCSSGRAISC